jgi:hypothetical protein
LGLKGCDTFQFECAPLSEDVHECLQVSNHDEGSFNMVVATEQSALLDGGGKSLVLPASFE